ncbi:MAG: cadherin-like beta sandwich domain-containing protein, partial [Candidatus Caldatribacteriota bacterium]|nr:cadherin-like beta sandwich domain-containing protein [Candidatus Caldatribacteriota bacterium]
MYNMYKLKPLFVLILLLCLMITLTSCTPNVIPSGNANLASLIFSYGNLMPAFNSEILDYSLTVEYTINEINFTATPEDNQANLNYRWQPAGESWSKWYELSSGIPSSDLALNTGNNTV